MQINFDPSVGQKITVSPLLLASHISSYAAVRFTAVVDNSEYEQISRDGGKLQLWSNNPYSDGSEWQEHGFTEDITNTVTSHAVNLTPGGQRLSLSLSVILPPGVNEVELSYTYRISYPDGQVKWLGKYGQNGVCVVHRQGSHITLGDQWCTGKDNTTFNLDAGGSSKALLNVLAGLDSSSYHLHAFDADGSDPSILLAHAAIDGAEAVVSNCSLLFIVPKHAPGSHILPQAFVISSSLGNSISLSATGDVSINANAENSLLFQVYEPRADLRSIVETAITHSMPGKIRALSIDRQNSLAVLATSAVHCPMRLLAIGLSPQLKIQTTEAELEQRDLENLFTDPLNSICVYPPFKTGADHILRDDTPDAKCVSLDIGTRYILSPESYLRCQGGPWRISVLSDHTNVRVPLEQPDVRMLPTPPASPKVPAEWPGASKQKPSSAIDRSLLAKRIAKALVTYVRYCFTVIFFPITIIFHLLSILRSGTSAKLDHAKKDSRSRKDDEARPRQTVTSEEHAGRTLHCRSLSLRVFPGQLTILLRPGEDVTTEIISRMALSIRFNGEELLGGFVEQKTDEAVLLTTWVDKEGGIEISAV